MKSGLFVILLLCATVAFALDGDVLIHDPSTVVTVIDDGISKRLTLRKGPNVVRAAVINGGGATDFCARFLDSADQPLKGFAVRLSEGHE
jgi:hypothetical protein